MSKRKRINLNALPEYEDKLLSSLAFWLDRKYATQAYNCLNMYLRQSEVRIMQQTRYYAHQLGMNEYDLMDLIHRNPGKVKQLLADRGIESEHEPDDSRDRGEEEE